MTNKVVAGECLECESSYYVEFAEELTSKDAPMFCPFCGTRTDDVTDVDFEDEDEDYSEDEDEYEED